MKLNWGTSIVIAFSLFMSFILYFVIKVQSNSKYDNELVVEEYYKHDAKFGDEMIKVQNAHDLTMKPIVSYNSLEISIVFPQKYTSNNISGKVNLYRPSNKKMDFEVPIILNNSTLTIPKNKLVNGRWDVSIEWLYNKKTYLTKKSIYID